MNPMLRLVPVLLLALLFLRLPTELPEQGDSGAWADNGAASDDYYLNNAQNETGANNIVTAVLFDYRAMDTLLEATVLFTAIAGIGAVLHKGRRGWSLKNDDDKGGEH